MVTGLFQCGTAASPHVQNFTLTLTGLPSESGGPMGGKFFGIMPGDREDVHGIEKLTWAQLVATADIGATSITLKEVVDWESNDEIPFFRPTLTPPQDSRRSTLHLESIQHRLKHEIPLFFSKDSLLCNVSYLAKSTVSLLTFTHAIFPTPHLLPALFLSLSFISQCCEPQHRLHPRRRPWHHRHQRFCQPFHR